MSRRWFLIILALAAYSGWNSWSNRAVQVKTPGMLAPDAPLQHNLSGSAAPVFQHNGYRIDAQARYSLQARLLRKEAYRTGREAELSPVDFALGWGPMSDNALLDQMTITQSGRFYWLRWQQLSVPVTQVMQNSANTHIIPANSHVAGQIQSMRPGQVIELNGYLVNAFASDGWHWLSSLTRKDTGAGACELFWVESARVVQSAP